MPSSSVSRVSVQFSGNSRTGQTSLSLHAYKGPRASPPSLGYLPAYPTAQQLPTL